MVNKSVALSTPILENIVSFNTFDRSSNLPSISNQSSIDTTYNKGNVNNNNNNNNTKNTP